MLTSCAPDVMFPAHQQRAAAYVCVAKQRSKLGMVTHTDATWKVAPIEVSFKPQLPSIRQRTQVPIHWKKRTRGVISQTTQSFFLNQYLVWHSSHIKDITRELTLGGQLYKWGLDHLSEISHVQTFQDIKMLKVTQWSTAKMIQLTELQMNQEGKWITLN